MFFFKISCIIVVTDAFLTLILKVLPVVFFLVLFLVQKANSVDPESSFTLPERTKESALDSAKKKLGASEILGASEKEEKKSSEVNNPSTAVTHALPEEGEGFKDDAIVPEALEHFSPAKPDENLQTLLPDSSKLLDHSDKEKKPIHSVHIEGIHRVDRQAILDHLPNRSYCTQGDLDVFVKNLFNSGLFKEVSVSLEKNTLTVRVLENPSISEVRFEGNQKVSRSDLKEDTTLQPRDIFSKEAISSEVKRVTQLYSNKGYYAAKVFPLIQRLKQNRVNVIFQIQEGNRSYNKKIRFFIDSKSPGFTDRTLKSVITSLEDRWWRILGDPAESYDKTRVEYDCDLLRKHYYRNGYLDVRVTAHTQLAKNREHFYITFFIQEGPQYCISDVKIQSEIKNLNLKGLESHISLGKGEVFNAEMPERVSARMAQELESRGLSFVEIRPIVDKNEEKKEVALCFIARKAPVVYVGKILMKGNYATNDRIFRRVLKLSEGDSLSINKINNSKELLENMDFFESVEIKTSATEHPKIQDVVVEVKEKGTGDIKFSGGYSTQDGIIGQIGLEERNLFGRALYGNFSAMVAQHGMDFRAGVANPFSFGRNLTLGGTVFFNRFRSTTSGNFSGEGAYKQSAGGGDIYARYPLSSTLSQSWGYSMHADHVSHFSPYMSPYILENMYGKYNILNASLEHKIDYARAHVENGEYVSGTGVQWSTVFHGVGGEIKCLKNIVMATHYIPLDNERTFILKFEVQGGVINRVGYMRFSDQFTLGLFSFPGFRFSGLGPRDERTGDALFARCYYTASIKFYWGLDFLGIPKETPLRAVVFGYTGSLWNSIFGKRDNAAYILSQNFQNRASYGAGLIWTLPMVGNIGFLFAKPVQRKDWDQTQTFLFVWGQSF
ncbi:outer membrane protein assembly factor BamA [Holospora obtusa F1]|uniref:Outer membrane protein assembly factor BamA n=1 Tax=Holospora obtusa F1 TaxID=1399147 RepID=W6TDM0_HOLOB|nr:outer membrane protein assembly factor BamA [Holospora obtusa]ETZ06841.1 outer membrane protein assembly factor BamA [Holospora obtusa F1]